MVFSRDNLFARAKRSAALCTFGSVSRRWIRAWRRVRWNGRMPIRSRVDSSSITWFAGCDTSQRSAGTRSLSNAAQAASAPRIANAQKGSATVSAMDFLPDGESSLVLRAFPGEEVEAAGDYDRGAEPHVRARHIAEHQKAEQRHVNDLLVEERRDHAGRRVSMREREQVVTESAQHAEQAGEGPFEHPP